MARTTMTDRPKRIDGLEISAVDDGYIIHQPERDRVHFFNHTGIVVLELCDGRNSAADIAELLGKVYRVPEPPRREVDEILARLQDEGLTESRSRRARPTAFDSAS